MGAPSIALCKRTRYTAPRRVPCSFHKASHLPASLCNFRNMYYLFSLLLESILCASTFVNIIFVHFFMLSNSSAAAFQGTGGQQGASFVTYGRGLALLSVPFHIQQFPHRTWGKDAFVPRTARMRRLRPLTIPI